MLVNEKWIHCFPQSVAVFLNPSVSDHSPGLVSVIEDYWNTGPRAFKYCEMWSSDYSCTEVNGCKMYRVVKKLQFVKSKLRILYSKKYSNISGRVDMAQ